MKLKYLLTVLAIVAISKSSFAQYAEDAVRFSTFQTGSTSRIKGIGNAGTAVGGDLTAVGGNPAGLGFFTKSEISATGEFDDSKVTSTYFGQSGIGSKRTGNLNNIAAVFYSRLNTPRGTDKTKGWLSVNFGAGYNRTNNFAENIFYKGNNPNNSINDYYAGLAASSGVEPGTLASWAYQSNLIDKYDPPVGFASNNVKPGQTQQTNFISRSGGQSEFNLSLGANYSNRLYLGFGIGITDLRYNSTNSFDEGGIISVYTPGPSGTPGTSANRDYASTYSQYQSTRGTGFNAKVGLIYKLLESVRVGATVTTPTYMSVDDSYSEGLYTILTSDGTTFNNKPVEYPLTYTMRTPFKAAGGLSIFLKQFGFISGDVEYMDYSTTHIDNSDDFDATFDNSQIKANYRSVINAHVGAEIKILPAIALRGGYGIQGSPLKTGGSSTKTITGGLGYRFGNYYVDAAYMNIKGSEIITPYTIDTLSPSAISSKSNNNFFLTIGFRY